MKMKLGELRGMFQRGGPVKLSGDGEKPRGRGRKLNQLPNEYTDLTLSGDDEWKSVAERIVAHAETVGGWPIGTEVVMARATSDGKRRWRILSPRTPDWPWPGEIRVGIEEERPTGAISKFRIPSWETAKAASILRGLPEPVALPDNAWVHSQADTPGSIWVVIREVDLFREKANLLARKKARVKFRHEVRNAYAVALQDGGAETSNYLLALEAPVVDPLDEE